MRKPFGAVIVAKTVKVYLGNLYLVAAVILRFVVEYVVVDEEPAVAASVEVDLPAVRRPLEVVDVVVHADVVADDERVHVGLRRTGHCMMKPPSLSCE